PRRSPHDGGRRRWPMPARPRLPPPGCASAATVPGCAETAPKLRCRPPGGAAPQVTAAAPLRCPSPRCASVARGADPRSTSMTEQPTSTDAIAGAAERLEQTLFEVKKVIVG